MESRELDERDPLAAFRQRFVVDDPDLIYLDGNSLGRMPRETAARIEELQRQWSARLIRGWNDEWLDLPARIGGKIAGLIGARADEVLMADSTSVNLFKLVVAALDHQSDRSNIVTDALNFPSDVYVLESARQQRRPEGILTVVPCPDANVGCTDAIADAITEDTALVALSHTAFKSGLVYPMARITEAAHARGALMLWDLSHSVGAMPIGLNECQADLAVGCTYKHLNGGPGAPAFLFVRQDLQQQLRNPVGGWFGHQRPFDFELDYRPAPGLRRFLSGTPGVLSLAAVEPGVDLVREATVSAIRNKSVAQTEYLVKQWRERLEPLGFAWNAPSDAKSRGAHVSLGHPEGWRIDQALIDRLQVIPDFRYPDNIRLGPSPLYTSFAELERAVDALCEVVSQRIYEQYSSDPPGNAT